MKFNYPKVVAALFFSFYFFYWLSTPNSYHFIDGVNLVIHEAGHTIFSFIFLGRFVDVLAGSLTQVLIPALFAFYFFRHRNTFSAAIMLMWVGQNLIFVARYAADAIVMQLPLLGGDNVIHDWNYLLTATHLLPYTANISGAIYGLGLITFLTAVALAFWSARVIITIKSSSYGTRN